MEPTLKLIGSLTGWSVLAQWTDQMDEIPYSRPIDAIKLLRTEFEKHIPKASPEHGGQVFPQFGAKVRHKDGMTCDFWSRVFVPFQSIRPIAQKLSHGHLTHDGSKRQTIQSQTQERITFSNHNPSVFETDYNVIDEHVHLFQTPDISVDEFFGLCDCHEILLQKLSV